MVRGTIKVNKVKLTPGDEFDEDLFAMESHRRDRIINVLLDQGRAKEMLETSDEFPISLGGPWYQLSNGKKARGLANAIEKQMLLET
jgi:hypothetical protein